MELRPLVAIAGPTGSGKSDLALAVAERFGGEIVNYDSVQVYRGFDVGSAKVPVAGRRRIRHHLIDIRDAGETYTAGDFVRDARALLPGIGLPVLCGGTGFYLRSLLRGLSPGPERNDALRADLERRDIRKLLERLDPEAARRIHPNDRNKSLRALELRILAGRGASALFAEQPAEPLEGYRTLLIGLDPPRAALYKHLDARCDRMWQGGLLEEVRRLLDSGVSPTAKPFESLGYRQALQPSTEALEEMKVKTRQYAKRQWTWFRAEPGMEWFPGFGFETKTQHLVLERVARFLEKT